MSSDQNAGSMTVGTQGTNVRVHNNQTNRGVMLPWSIALYFGQVIQRMARGVIPGERETIGPLAVHRHSGNIVVSEKSTGRTVFFWPLHAAAEAGNLIIAQAHQAESTEADIADSIAFDHAVLQRLGISLGLTSNPFIQAVAEKEAAWNSELRKAIPSSDALRQTRVGEPRIVREVLHRG